MSPTYWGLIVFDKGTKEFIWVMGSSNRNDCERERLNLHDKGYRLPGMFIQGFPAEPDTAEIEQMINLINRLDAIIKRDLND